MSLDNKGFDLKAVKDGCELLVEVKAHLACPRVIDLTAAGDVLKNLFFGDTHTAGAVMVLDSFAGTTAPPWAARAHWT